MSFARRIPPRSLTAIAVLSAIAITCCADAQDKRSRPSVLLIMTDDQGFGDVRSHGNDKIDTPTLDALAKRSVRFDRFFVSPVCAPTRASLLTGRYAIRTGVSGVTKRQEVMRADETTIAEVFRAAGYATGCFGKWHNGEQYPNHPRGQGFDEFFGFCGGHWNDYFDTPLEHDGKQVPTKGYITDVITDAALKFLDAHSDDDFFCYVPYNAPHSPWQLPDKYFDKSKARGLPNTTASAYGMVENLDENIGRLLTRLDDLELTDDTIVVFLTDNGPNGKRFNGGMRGAKGSVHEGGVRVPCFVSWAGRLEPRTVEEIAAHIDLLPTLAQLCNVTVPAGKPRDGVSLVPLLEGKAEDWPDRLLYTYRAGTNGRPARGAVRSQRHRFVREPNGDQLYDLVRDPGQKQNIAKTHPEIAERLKTSYETWVKEATRGSDRRTPIPIGYAEAPNVELPGVEAEFTGGVKFHNVNGYAHDWITNWTSTDDRIWWDVESATAGRYEVVLSYASGKKTIGSRLRLSVGETSTEFTLDTPFDTGKRARPERDMSKGPRWLRDFTTKKIGTVTIPKGRQRIELRALAIPETSVGEIDALRLRKVK